MRAALSPSPLKRVLTVAVSKPTAAVVIALTGTGFDSATVSAIIDDAAMIAEKCIASYDATRQAAIVKWLAAHLIASTGGEGVAVSESLGDASTSWQRAPLGDALKGTTYGQQALLLDTNGCLAKQGRARATVERV